MSDTVIRAENIGKRYHIGALQDRKETVAELVTDTFASPIRRLKGVLRGAGAHHTSEDDIIWALRNISFEVNRGDVMGIIGRNGAGKSTLLKVLARITEPTEGWAEIRGRVGALLEVGTGFHRELTGRENIYLNGAILGMSKVEIEEEFDAIIEFAGVDTFVDTPVKHYSSGMMLRLGFAVAAHLRPEILIVDEILAVGDVNFQKKCMAKLDDVAGHGRTVLFVSHNLAAVSSLCTTSVLLDYGKVAYSGSVTESIARYSQMRAVSTAENDPNRNRPGWHDARLEDEDGNEIAAAGSRDALRVTATLRLNKPWRQANLFMILQDASGHQLLHVRRALDSLAGTLEANTYRMSIDVPPLWLGPGVYSVHFKFVGSSEAGENGRYISEPMFFQVDGNTAGLGGATLMPDVDWQVGVGAVPENEPVAAQ